MSASTDTATIGELVAERPARSRLFEKLGFDYCCGGKKTLEQACRARGLDPATVAALLNESNADPNTGAVDVSAMSLTQLADHIEQTHHAYLKDELPRLHRLIQKIAAKHGPDNPELTQLPRVYAAFRSELELHMAKEERVLFPLIRQIEDRASGGSLHCGGIENPIRVMEIEHQHAGDALSHMRRITDDFNTPQSACNTYRAVMHSLIELEADLHQHVHKENNILFPRAVAMVGTQTLSKPIART